MAHNGRRLFLVDTMNNSIYIEDSKIISNVNTLLLITKSRKIKPRSRAKLAVRQTKI